MRVPNRSLFALVEEAVAEGRDATVRVEGNSMLPFIRGGVDSVRFAPVDARRLRKGDIILFRYHGSHVMHRLVWHSGNILMARGDGLKGAPETFGRQDVVARVSEIIKPGRTVSASSPGFRTVSWIWRHLRPFRTYLLYLLKLAAQTKS